MKIKKGRLRLILVALILIIALEASILLSFKKSSPRKTLQQYANHIITTCSKTSYHPACFEQEIPKLMDPPINLSLEDTFKITTMVQSQDPSFGYCHVLAHKLGSKEEDKDPSKWLSIIPRCPAVETCGGGCLHGVIQERFRSDVLSDVQIENLKPDLAMACEKRDDFNPTSFDQFTCYHGLGHLSVYISNADLKKSLQICDGITLKEGYADFRWICYGGVFMQLFQPFEPEDKALVKAMVPTKENLRNFCLQFDGEYQYEACWIEGWPLFKEEIETPSGLVKFCSAISNPNKQNRCFVSLFHGIAQMSNLDSDKIITFCNKMPREKQGQCFIHGGKSMIQGGQMFIDREAKICSFAKIKEVSDECYSSLIKYNFSIFKKDSSESLQFCNDLPDVWKTDCLKND